LIALHAAKAIEPADMARFVHWTPFQSKKFAQDGGLKIRGDWDDVKIDVMTDLVRQKFFNSMELGNMLLGTGRQKLVEGNDLGDVFWGVCDGIGQNNLGVILMGIRDELRRRK
jgi:ribA/ribD-fused uncharacterized protein